MANDVNTERMKRRVGGGMKTNSRKQVHESARERNVKKERDDKGNEGR